MSTSKQNNSASELTTMIPSIHTKRVWVSLWSWPKQGRTSTFPGAPYLHRFCCKTLWFFPRSAPVFSWTTLAREFPLIILLLIIFQRPSKICFTRFCSNVFWIFLERPVRVFGDDQGIFHGSNIFRFFLSAQSSARFCFSLLPIRSVPTRSARVFPSRYASKSFLLRSPWVVCWMFKSTLNK